MSKFVEPYLSFEIDEHLKHRYEWESYWIITLSDGRHVFQDDERPGIKPHSAWERLGTFIKNTDLHIDKMVLKYRSVKRNVGEDSEGFFFVRSALGMTGSEETLQYYLVGCMKNGVLQIKKYQVPGLIYVSSETRNPSDCGICYISNVKE